MREEHELNITEHDLFHPSTEAIKFALGVLLTSDPLAMGCGYIKNMYNAPERFGVRRDIVKMAMTTFFSGLWDANRTKNFYYQVWHVVNMMML